MVARGPLHLEEGKWGSFHCLSPHWCHSARQLTTGSFVAFKTTLCYAYTCWAVVALLCFL
jgi:hypothetical protein